MRSRVTFATMEAALAGDLDVAFPNTRVLLPLLKAGKACFKGGIGFVDVNTVGMVTKVEITEPCRVAEEGMETRVAEPGDLLDVSEQDALQLVSSGRAVLAKPKAKAAKPKTQDGDGA